MTTTATRQRAARPPAVDVQAPPTPVSGIVDVGDAAAFLRTSGYARGPGDISLSIGQVRQFGLRKGDHIEGAIQPPRPGRARDRYATLAAPRQHQRPRPPAGDAARLTSPR